jgi:ketosteroid isomerase-like protein
MATTDETQMRALAQRFFDAVEAGDIETAGSYYAPGVVIWHNFDNVEQTKEQNLAILAAIPRRLGDRVYADRRVEVFAGGFVQQHVLHATRMFDGARLAMPAVIICRVKDGKIVRLDEYLDSAHVAEFRKNSR